jgi:probable HAF family extracellular repeat protein
MAYKIIDLGSQNGDFSEAFAINSESQVTGMTGNPKSPNSTAAPAPFLWTQGVMQVLDIPAPYRYGQGFDLNCSDEVVGFLYNGTADIAMSWIGGVAQQLPWVGDASYGRSVNDCGLVCGDAGVPSNNIKAHCSPAGNLSPILPTPPNVLLSDRYCRAYGINSLGTIVGGSDTGNPIAFPQAFAPPVLGMHACLWDKGIVHDLGALHPNEGSEAYGINDKGQVVGRSGNNAFLWQNGVFTDLGPGAAFNINNNGFDIGDTFLWHAGTRTPLANLLPANSGWQITQGRDINDSGAIVGTGLHAGTPGNAPRGFLMFP